MGPIWAPYGPIGGPYGIWGPWAHGTFDRHSQTLTMAVDPPPSAALPIKGPNGGLPSSAAKGRGSTGEATM